MSDRDGWYYRILSPIDRQQADYAFENDLGAGPFVSRDEALRDAGVIVHVGERVVTGHCTAVLESPPCPFSANDAVERDNDDWTESANENWRDLAADAQLSDLEQRLEALWSEWIDRHELRIEVWRVEQIEEVRRG